MPAKKAHVKNEKQYEALKDKGMSKERAAQDRELAGCVEARRQEVGLRAAILEAGRHDRAAQGRRAQGRQGDGEEVMRGRADESREQAAGGARARGGGEGRFCQSGSPPRSRVSAAAEPAWDSN